ncbi:MAG TPA: hypothetical protein VEA37_09630 [Flavobacterium sp.]|nr:hypothetical protein [Flavobacterium sp.]
MKTVRTYSLEWLDSLVSVTLNPNKPYRSRLSAADIASLAGQLPEEALQVRSELIDKVFALNKDSQVQHLVKKYHEALLSLQGLLADYRNDATFNAQQLNGLDTEIAACLDDLLTFIKRRFGYYIGAEIKNADAAHPVDIRPGQKERQPDHKQKILCTLSGDQIALILRGADEAQLLKARSMNAVFKSIVPFLSTEHRENLSPDSIRSKAYNPEEADRDAAVKALETIIRKIKTY